MSTVRSLLAAALFATGAAAAQPVVGPGVAETLARDGHVEVMVALRDAVPEGRRATASVASLRAYAAASQGRVLSALPRGDADVATRFETVPALVLRLDTEAALGALAAHDDVVRVDLDEGGGSGGSSGLSASVPLVQASEWHDRGFTGEGVVVAVLDSGIDTDHPDFANAIVDESCFLNFDGDGQCPDGTSRQTGDGAAEDDHGHGSNVTGVLASRGTVSALGVAPGVDIVSVKVLNNENSFNRFSEIVAALDYLIANPGLGVQVVNMSLGTSMLFPGVCDSSASWLISGARAAGTLRDRGVALYASSMNNGSSTSVAAPACLSDVTAVAASTLSDAMASISNTGPQVEFVAPGVSITASGRGGGTSTFTGTSQASPHAAGCAALLLNGGSASTPDAIDDLFRTAASVSVTDDDNGRSFPRLDCWDDSFTVSTEGGTASEGVSLTLPAPNPAHTTARLTLRLGAPEAVRAVLVDGLGRRVATIYDGPVAADTPHALAVDVRDLPAGVYTLRVSGSTVAASRRILVVR